MKKEEKNGGNGGTALEAELIQYIRAGYSHFWIYTLEPRRAEWKIIDLLHEYKTKEGSQYETLVWDITHAEWSDAATAVAKFAELPRMSALVARNFNMFITEQDEDKPLVVQHLVNGVEFCRSYEGRKLFFAISSDKNIPSELERDFLLWEFNLPDEEELGEALDFLCESSGIGKIKSKNRQEIINAAKGMTYEEAKNAYSLSAVCSGKMVAKLISKQRAAMIEKQASLKVVEYEETLSDLIGLDGIVDFALKSIPSPLSRGVILIGPTGTGKSHLWKGISNAVNKLMITFSFAQIYGKYYGESEKAINAVIAIIKAIGDCIVFIDEFEKAFAGAGGRLGSAGADVERRTTAEWLKFMQDRPEGIYVAATCNDITAIPPEYLRSERWDAIFYVPMPTNEALKKMISHYKKYYKVNGDIPDVKGWTGSDVKTCCRMAKMFNISMAEAGIFVTPTSRIKKHEIAALEKEAKDKGYNRADTLPEKTIAKAKSCARAVDI